MIVCADDYGWSDDANRAIVELVAARRVSAVSCMAGLPHCAPDNLKPLLEHADHIDVGLHFTVTARFLDGDRFERSVPARLVNFFSALKSCVLRKITPAQAREEIAAQYQRFAERTGRLPDFIDGHLHVQQLPVLADAMIQFVENIPVGNRPYVRNSYMPFAKIRAQGVSFWRSASISMSGKQFRRRLAASRPAAWRPTTVLPACTIIGTGVDTATFWAYSRRTWNRRLEFSWCILGSRNHGVAQSLKRCARPLF